MEWSAKLIEHNNENRIAIYFEKNKELNERIKKLVGVKWSNTLKAWHVPDNDVYRTKFGIEIKTPSYYLPTNELGEKILHFSDWLKQKRYSPNTINSYNKVLLVFFGYFKTKDILEITNNDVFEFNKNYIIEKKLSATYQSQFINALKLFYSRFNNKKINLELLERPHKNESLPKVFSEEEILKLINAIDNLKHKCMICLIYSAGLRRSELLNLKLIDIDSNRMLILIKQGKGMKDRIVPLSENILVMLREYFIEYKPKKFLFEGQYGEQYSDRSVNLVIKKAALKANIKRTITPHMLRHSYATHLLEGGTNLRIIQELLGHKSPRTTQIYTHVSRDQIGKVQSPFDKLKLKENKK
jgi:integrase/recombinase XerD